MQNQSQQVGLRVLAMQMVLDMYEHSETVNRSVDKLNEDTEKVYQYLKQDLDEQEKGAEVTTLRPVH